MKSEEILKKSNDYLSNLVAGIFKKLIITAVVGAGGVGVSAFLLGVHYG
jgi:hypothetical protein